MCEPDSAAKGALWAIDAEIAYWRGDLERAAERAAAAAERLDPGTIPWFSAMAATIGARGQQGENARVAEALLRVAVVTAEDGARGAQIVTLCRGMAQLFWAHYPDGLDAVRHRLDDLVALPEPLAPHEAGWVHRIRAESAWLHGRHIDVCLAEFAACCIAFEEARAQRNLCVAKLNRACLAGWSGDTETALSLVASARADAARLGSGFLVVYGLTVRGLIEAYSGDPAAEGTMREALPHLAGSPRLSLIAHLVVGHLALERGDVDSAAEQARAANARPAVVDLQLGALALNADVLRARGETGAALDAARTAVALSAQCRDLELTEGMADVAAAEAMNACGDGAGAKDVLALAYGRMLALGATIASETQRERFYARPLANARIAGLAREWLDA